MPTFVNGVETRERAPHFSSIPYSFLEALGKRYTLGDDRYGRDNWRNGLSDIEFLRERANHLAWHVLRYLSGEFGEDTEEENLAAAAWGCATLIEAKRRGYSIHDEKTSGPSSGGELVQSAGALDRIREDLSAHGVCGGVEDSPVRITSSSLPQDAVRDSDSG
jgi:hypothetical protein